jgi:hypothetical protein
VSRHTPINIDDSRRFNVLYRKIGCDQEAVRDDV